MFSTVHQLTELIPIKTKPNCRHLSNCIASINHMFTPCLHNLLKFWKVIWNDISMPFLNCIIRTNIIEKPPLGIKRRRRRRDWFVLLRILMKSASMISSPLFKLRCSSNLIIKLRIYIFGWLISIEIFRSGTKILLKQI